MRVPTLRSLYARALTLDYLARRVHKECMLGIQGTLTVVGAVRKCPLCRGATLAPRAFERRGVMS